MEGDLIRLPRIGDVDDATAVAARPRLPGGPGGGRRPGPPRPHHRRPVLAVVLAVVLTAGSVAGCGYLLVRAKQHDANVVAQAAGYTPAPLPVVTQGTASRFGASGGPLITVVSDDLTTAPRGIAAKATWPAIAATKLQAQIASSSQNGSGYLRAGDGTSADRTFVRQAQLAPSTSKVVVLFGGANDAGSSALSLLQAATQAFAAAKSAAPDAQVIVIGPGWGTSQAPSSVLAVRDILRSAAGVAGATFVDPIGQRWLSSDRGLVGSDHTTLTAKGEQAVADRIERIVSPVLAAAG